MTEQTWTLIAGLMLGFAFGYLFHLWQTERDKTRKVFHERLVTEPYKDCTIECEPCFNDFGTYACVNPKHPCYAGAGPHQHAK